MARGGCWRWGPRRWGPRLAGLALLAAGAGAMGMGHPGRRGLFQAPEPACASLRKRPCKASGECQWKGRRRGGCVEATNACEVIQARRGRRRLCRAVSSTQCECSRKRGKCGNCRLVPPEARGYVCKISTADALAALQDPPIHSKRTAPPYGATPFQAAIDFAEELAAFVRDEQQRAGDDSHEANTLRIAFYTNRKDTNRPCAEAGGGAGLCQLLSSIMERPRMLGQYLGALLGAGAPGVAPLAEAWTDDGSFRKAVNSIGYKPFAEFIAALCPGACDASGACNSTCDQVYLPEDIFSATGRESTMTLEQLATAEAEGLQFWGMSGGGGSGAGFEIVCGQETIVTGGGGGGGGTTSPEGGTAVQAGGGGGGGAQVGAKGTPMVGAGSGNHPPGKLDVNEKAVSPAEWRTAVGSVREAINGCIARGENVHLRGGGAAGWGFEFFKPHNVTDPSTIPEEVKPHALSLSYGFQFAMGRGALIEDKEKPSLTGTSFVSCPGSKSCEGCVATPRGLSRGSLPGGSGGDAGRGVPNATISTVFMCASRTAVDICRRAGYGAYASYQQCNQPLERLFYEEHLPDDPRWAFQKAAPPGPPPGPTRDGRPPVTDEALRALRAEWCPRGPGGGLPGCPLLAACAAAP